MAKNAKLERRVAVLEYGLAEMHRERANLVAALGAVTEYLRTQAEAFAEAAKQQYGMTVTRRLLIVDSCGRAVIQLAATDDGGPVVQIVTRDASGEIATVDENLFEQS